MATHCRTHVWETVLAGKWQHIGDASLQDALEAAFSAASDGYQFDARGYAYEIDFGRMVQLNKSTKRERKLRRVLDPSAVSRTAVPATPAVAVAAPVGAVPAVVSPPAAAVATRRAKVVGAPVPKAKAVPAPVSSGKPSPALPTAPGIPASVPKPAGPPRPQGTVKSFNEEKGYGFISLDSGDVFFHLSALVDDSVEPNDTVEVLLAKDRAGRSRASEVRVLKKGPTYRQGTVKSFFEGKGYGFISLDSGDVFFHLSALVGDSVRPNDTVEVLLAKDRDGKSRASEVRVLKKGSIYRMMCRNKCCQAKGDRHFEDRCPRRLQRDDSSVSTATS